MSSSHHTSGPDWPCNLEHMWVFSHCNWQHPHYEHHPLPRRASSSLMLISPLHQREPAAGCLARGADWLARFLPTISWRRTSTNARHATLRTYARILSGFFLLPFNSGRRGVEKGGGMVASACGDRTMNETEPRRETLHPSQTYLRFPTHGRMERKREGERRRKSEAG